MKSYAPLILTVTATLIISPLALKAEVLKSPKRFSSKKLDKKVDKFRKNQTVKKKKLRANLIKIKLGGLLRNWLTISLDENDVYSGLGTSRMSFRIRMARLFAKVQLGKIAYSLVMIDAARVLEQRERELSVKAEDGKKIGTVGVMQSPHNSFLLDARFTILGKFVNFSFGQRKIPVSLEGLGSSGKLMFAERADISRKFGGVYDIGLWLDKKFKYFSYHVGIYNGSGINRLDGDLTKDLGLRVELYPWAERLLVGASFYRTLGPLEGSGKMILGGDIRLDWRRLHFQGEFYWRRMGRGRDKTFDSMGFYAYIAWDIVTSPILFQGAVRGEWFDGDIELKGGDFWRVTAGLNLLLLKHYLKLQLNFVHTQSKKPDSAGGIREERNDQFLLMGQVAF